VTGKAVVMKIS